MLSFTPMIWTELMPISFLSSQGLFQTGTPFPVQPDQHHLWTPSRRPYTVYLASPIVITEPCHSSKGCTPMAWIFTEELKRDRLQELKLWGDWKCETWRRETGQLGTISQGWTSRDLFQCSSRCSLQVCLIQGVLYELLVGFMFVVLFLSVLLIATCGRRQLSGQRLGAL